MVKTKKKIGFVHIALTQFGRDFSVFLIKTNGKESLENHGSDSGRSMRNIITFSCY